MRGAILDAEVIAERDGLVIRHMLDSEQDFERMVGWRNRPHVRYWWDPDDPPLTLDGAKEEYGPDTRAESPSTVCIVELEGKPVGFMQFYRWTSYSQYAQQVGIPFDDGAWGIDLFIGEPDQVGRGLGVRMVNLMCEYLEEEQGATSVVLTTEVDNLTAIRCYEKAGFVRRMQILDTDTRNGERVKSWVMVRPQMGRRTRQSR